MGEDFQAKVDRFWERVLHPFSGGANQRFNNRGGWIYYAMAVLTVIAFIFLGVKITTYTNTHVADSGLGQKSLLTLEDNDLTLISETYNPKNKFAQILISDTNENDTSLYKIEAIVSEVMTQKQLKSRLVKVTDQYYVLKIYDIPHNYQQLVIDVGVMNLDNNQQVNNVDLSHLLSSQSQKDNSNISNKFEQGVWKISGENMKHSLTLKAHPDEYYTILYAKLEQDNARSIIKKINKVIRADTKTLKKLNEQINSLKASERYQTKEEIKDTETNIVNLKSSISTTKEDIDDQEKLKNQLVEKIEKLELQRSDARKTLQKNGEKEQ